MKSTVLVFSATFIVVYPGSLDIRCANEGTAAPIRSELIIKRTASAWESQQVQEPCILLNPKDPARLVMFYSGVPMTNRDVCFIGKAWALKSAPFTWHQDPHNPVFSPGRKGWDSGNIRLDSVLYIAEEDAYYIYYSATTGSIQDHIGLAICPAGADGLLRHYPCRHSTRRRPTDPLRLSRQRLTLSKWPRRPQFSANGMRKSDGGTGICITPTAARTASSPGSDWPLRVMGKPGHTALQRERPARHGPDIQVHARRLLRMATRFLKLPTPIYLSIEVGISAGQRWRPVIAVSQHPDTGWEQLDVDTVLQTKWEGLYRDDTIYHVATPAFYLINGK